MSILNNKRKSLNSYELTLKYEMESENNRIKREDEILEKKLQAISSLSESILMLAVMVHMSAPVINVYCNGNNDEKVKVQEEQSQQLN